MSERLIKDLAIVLNHDAENPSLCDLVAIAGQNNRDLKEAVRLLRAFYAGNDHVELDAESFLKDVNRRL